MRTVLKWVADLLLVAGLAGIVYGCWLLAAWLGFLAGGLALFGCGVFLAWVLSQEKER